MENKQNARNIPVDVIFENGSRRRVLITSGTLDLVKRAAMVMPHLFEGTGFNPLNAEASNIVAVTRADHDILHQGYREQQAAFRLGQMDMQASIADMLTDLADGTQGVVCSTLIDAAQRVRGLCLCEKSEDV